MSKPFAFRFDDDDIESSEAEDAAPNHKPVTTEGESQEIEKPRLHTLYDLVCQLGLPLPENISLPGPRDFVHLYSQYCFRSSHS